MHASGKLYVALAQLEYLVSGLAACSDQCVSRCVVVSGLSNQHFHVNFKMHTLCIMLRSYAWYVLIISFS